MVKTVDNIGIEWSEFYAQSQQALDQTIIKDSRAIPGQTQIDVTIPIPTEYEALFGLKVNFPWAFFPPPAKFFEQKRGLFTKQVIPSLGTPEKRELQLERISQITKAKEATKDASWEDRIEFDQEEKEKNTLQKLFKTINSLEQDFVEFKSKCVQYQKG